MEDGECRAGTARVHLGDGDVVGTMASLETETYAYAYSYAYAIGKDYSAGDVAWLRFSRTRTRTSTSTFWLGVSPSTY